MSGHQFQSGRLSFTVNHHTAGACLAEASRDEKQWTTLATKNGVGSVQASLPAELLPAEMLFVRLRSAAGSNNFQVNQIEFEAPLDGKPAEGRGRTLFVDVPSLSAARAIERITLDDVPGSGQATLRYGEELWSERNVSVDRRSVVLAGNSETAPLEGRGTYTAIPAE